jgi:competence protein ComGC
VIRMKRIIKEQKGFALVITLLGLLVMSILGVTIIGVTTSNYNLTKIDSRSQSTYYIAEAGANYIIDKINKEVQENVSQFETSAEFFQYIEDQFTNDTVILDSFEENYGEQPKAFITISQIGTDEDLRDYKIESVGRLGNNSRKVSAVISLNWSSGREVGNIDDVFLYSPGLSYNGNEINGDGTVIIERIEQLNGGVRLNVKRIYILDYAIDVQGNQFGYKNNPGEIYVANGISFGTYGDVYGDLYVKGTFTPGGANFHGNVYVDGDIDFGDFSYMGTFHKSVAYTGEMINKKAYFNTSKFKKVPEVPGFKIPQFYFKEKDEQWYRQNNYAILGNVKDREIKDNDRLFVESLECKPSYTNRAENIVIVSKGDIKIDGWFNKMTGTIVSINGKVYMNQGIFDGVILTKEGFYSSAGGSIITMREITEPIPVEIYSGNEGDNGDNGDGGDQVSKLEIKRPIKEE